MALERGQAHTLEGAPGTPFEGLRLEIPEGAVQDDVEIRIQRATQLSILPDAAEGVGPAFVFEPADLVFEKPVKLTLPVVPSTRALYDEPAEACKVWLRANEDWRLVENVETSESSVTVEVDQLGTALSGVALVAKPATPAGSCEGLANVKCMPLSCTNAGAFCLEQIPSVRPKSPFAVLGKRLWFQEVQSGGGRLSRFDLDTKTLTRFFATSCQLGDLNGDTTNQFVGDAAGNAWRRNCLIDFASRKTVSFELPKIAEGPAAGFPQFADAIATRSDGSVVIVGLNISGPDAGRTFLNSMGSNGVTTSTSGIDRLPNGAPVRAIGHIIADPDSASGLWLVGPSGASENVGAAIRIDAAGKVLRRIDGSTERRIVGTGGDSDDLVQLIPNNVLAVRKGAVITDTVEERIDGLAEQEKIYNVAPGATRLPAVGVAIPSLAENAGFARFNSRIFGGQVAAVDDSGGIWAVVTTQINGVGVNLTRLVHFPAEGGQPFVLDSDMRILQVVAANANRIVLRAIPAGATEAAAFVIRRNP